MTGPDLLPLAAMLVFYGVALVGRALLQRLRFGSSGLVAGRSLPEMMLLLPGVGMLVEAVLAATAPSALANTELSSTVFELSWLRPLGLTIALIALVLTVWAQLQMGASWRVGIDTHTRPGLITGGLFRLSRNPIYDGLLLAVMGFVALLPNWLSVGMLLLSVISIRLQVRREERFLLDSYGDDYRRYASRVGRFVPGLGLLASP
jgi:protein-S-isoprenylcysteine O-methyltransferase Ste14